jgi:hypothetical protein
MLNHLPNKLLLRLQRLPHEDHPRAHHVQALHWVDLLRVGLLRADHQGQTRDPAPGSPKAPCPSRLDTVG